MTPSRRSSPGPRRVSTSTGGWRDADHGGRFDVLDPADRPGARRRRRRLGRPTRCDALDAAARRAARLGAYAAARARRDPAPRLRAAHRAGRRLRPADDASRWARPLAEAQGEVAYGAEFFRWFSEEAVRIDGRWMHGARRRQPAARRCASRSGRACSSRRGTSRWRWAPARSAPAVAAGCTMVVKPAELTPLTMLALAAVLEEAGLPAGRPQRRPDHRARAAVGRAADGRRPAAQGHLHRLHRGRAALVGSRPSSCCGSRWSSAATRRSSSSRTPTSTRPSTAP